MQKVLKKVHKPEMDSNILWLDLTAQEVRKCYKLGENFTVIYEDKVTILTPEDLRDKIIGKTDSGHGYELFAYQWNPTNCLLYTSPSPRDS